MSPFYRSWMQIWCWGTLAFGVVLAAAAVPGLEGPTVWFYDLVHWPIDGASSWGEDVRFTCGVLGAVMIGWALTIFVLADLAARVDAALEARLWRGLTLAIGVWFVVDSAISIATGAPVNAVSNTAFVAAFLVPVLGSGVLAKAT